MRAVLVPIAAIVFASTSVGAVEQLQEGASWDEVQQRPRHHHHHDHHHHHHPHFDHQKPIEGIQRGHRGYDSETALDGKGDGLSVEQLAAMGMSMEKLSKLVLTPMNGADRNMVSMSLKNMFERAQSM